MKQILGWLASFFASGAIKKVIKCIPAFVAEAEKAMADGKITPEERKAFVWKAIDTIATEFGTKIGGIIRIGISFLIDTVAKKLPSKDIKIPDIILKITKEW